ncbi:Ferredoxin 2Fe-2S [Bienertia sinuspersici]
MQSALSRGRRLLVIFSTTTKQQQHHLFSFSSFFQTSTSTSTSLSSSIISPFSTLMASDDSSANYGFDRPEMFSSSLSNTVDFYERHLFLCYKNPQSWPSSVENSDDDLLPMLFSSVLKSRQHDLPLKTRLTICAGCNGTECADGDLYIFPEMYAGNVIIFGTNPEGKVTGDWYGYVTPNDVPDLLDVHIGKGEIIEKLWRGQMGLKFEAAEKEENKPSTENIQEKTEEKSRDAGNEVKETTSCCQGPSAVSCCRDGSVANGEAGVVNPKEKDGPCKKSMLCLPSWAGKWDQGDLLMVGAVVGAVATVAVAYSVFRRSA